MKIFRFFQFLMRVAISGTEMNPRAVRLNFQLNKGFSAQYPSGFFVLQSDNLSSRSLSFECRHLPRLQKKSAPSTTKVLTVMGLLPVGGTLLALAGLTFAGTMTGLPVTFPLFVLFSPVLVPAAFAIGLAVTGILASGAFGLTAISSLSWVLSYLRGTVPGQIHQAKRGSGRHDSEQGPGIEAQRHGRHGEEHHHHDSHCTKSLRIIWNCVRENEISGRVWAPKFSHSQNFPRQNILPPKYHAPNFNFHDSIIIFHFNYQSHFHSHSVQY